MRSVSGTGASAADVSNAPASLHVTSRQGTRQNNHQICFLRVLLLRVKVRKEGRDGERGRERERETGREGRKERGGGKEGGIVREKEAHACRGHCPYVHCIAVLVTVCPPTHSHRCVTLASLHYFWHVMWFDRLSCASRVLLRAI